MSINSYETEFYIHLADMRYQDVLETIFAHIGDAQNMAEDLTGIGKVTEALSGAAKEFLGKVLGPATDEVALLIANEVRYFRVIRERRIKRLLEEAQSKANAAGIEPQAVALTILVPLLDYAWLEEESTSPTSKWVKWVGLLTSAATGTSIHPKFPRILSELMPIEAQILEFLYEEAQSQSIRIDRLSYYGASFADLPGFFGVSHEQVTSALDALFSQGLCQPTQALPSVFNRILRYTPGVGRYERVSLTVLGWNFVEAFIGPPEQNPPRLVFRDG